MAKAAAAKKTTGKAPSKSEVLNSIAQETGLSRKDVGAVLESLSNEISKNVGKKGPGVFQIPGLVKIVRQNVPAKPAQKGVKNPFTGEIRDVPAKPASVKVKVRALKNLKAMV
jgi:nucleoid DNA-binding protein